MNSKSLRCLPSALAFLIVAAYPSIGLSESALPSENFNQSSCDREDGILSTLAGGGHPGDGGSALDAALGFPLGIAFDRSGNLYFADETNHAIRKIDSTGVITTVAGTLATAGYEGDGGSALDARLNLPSGISVGYLGNIYIADRVNASIRKVTAATGLITTIAGTGNAGFGGDGGLATDAKFAVPMEVSFDSAGNVYVVDQNNHRIRKINRKTGIIKTVAGNGFGGFCGDGGLATDACLNKPGAALVDERGNIFISDKMNHRIRFVHAKTGRILTIAGTGQRGNSGDGGGARAAKLSAPSGLTRDVDGNLYVADVGNNRIRKIEKGTNVITAFVSSGDLGFCGDGGPALDACINIATGFGSPGMAFNANGDFYFTDRGNQRLRKVDAATSTIETFAGGGDIGETGLAIDAHMVVPAGVHVDEFAGPGNTQVYIADRGNNIIRKVDVLTGTVETAAGSLISGFEGDGGLAVDALLNLPIDVTTNGNGDIYISDQFNNRIRKVDGATGLIETIAGIGYAGFNGDNRSAISAMLKSPTEIDLDDDGNLYIADSGNSRIRKIDAITGLITTVAGSGQRGFSGDGGPATSAKLSQPSGIAVDSAGNLYIADEQNHRVRFVSAIDLTISTIAGNAQKGSAGDCGPATEASLFWPTAVDVDVDGNVYIADWFNKVIRRIDTATGIISTIAGNGESGFSGDGGSAVEGLLNLPRSVSVDSSGSVYIGDVPNGRIRRVVYPSGD